ncbi:MAG: hypothetical protein V9H69_12955 [Anaerolineae bacterium]
MKCAATVCWLRQSASILGRKMSAEQRERLLQLSFEDFENTRVLAAAVGLSPQELAEGVEHPRARLRHF